MRHQAVEQWISHYSRLHSYLQPTLYLPASVGLWPTIPGRYRSTVVLDSKSPMVQRWQSRIMEPRCRSVQFVNPVVNPKSKIEETQPSGTQPSQWLQNLSDGWVSSSLLWTWPVPRSCRCHCPRTPDFQVFDPAWNEWSPGPPMLQRRGRVQ